MIVYLTEPTDIHPEAIKKLSDAGHKIAEGALSDQMKKEIEVLFIRTYTTVDRLLLKTLPKLKYVLRAGVGLDNVDLELCKERGIEVINAPGSNANAVTEYVVGVTILALRFLLPQIRSLSNGGWRSRDLIGEEIKGKVLGLIGCGAIGRLLVKKLNSWELSKVIGFDPYLSAEVLASEKIEKTEFESVLANSDIISLHLPLTNKTKHLLSRRQFSLLKNNALLINTSRGGIIDEEALIERLRSKRISAAVLDVFEFEPNIRNDLLRLDNLIATPHVASYTRQADLEMSVQPVNKFLSRLYANN